MKHAARWISPLLTTVAVALLFGQTAVPATAQQLVPQLTTGRGCRETGNDPTYAIGESIVLTFRVGSATVPRATTTIIDETPDDRTVVLSFGQLATNQTYRFTARIGGPSGVETLSLRATIQGNSAQSAPCSFRVVGGTPLPTRTRTPTSTRTPAGNPTPTPDDDLSGDVRTNRGCREAGDAATFAVGETVIIGLRLDSDSASRANASLLNSRPGGLQTLISFGSVPTNVPLSFAGRIGAPSGMRTLVLRGSLSGPQHALDTCSFLVVGDLPPIATPTRRATRTSTPTRTATPTRTFTPPNGFCVGACTQPASVTVNDLLTVIEIAAGRTSVDECPSADANGDQQVSLEEVLQAVNNALDGCPD
jgi:hypothetical protein